MSVDYSYGTFQYGEEEKCDGMLDLERMGSREETVSHSPAEIAMRPLADQVSYADSTNSHDTCDSAQAGVKRQEAISSTWSKSGLAVAYLGWVTFCLICRRRMHVY